MSTSAQVDQCSVESLVPRLRFTSGDPVRLCGDDKRLTSFGSDLIPRGLCATFFSLRGCTSFQAYEVVFLIQMLTMGAEARQPTAWISRGLGQHGRLQVNVVKGTAARMLVRLCSSVGVNCDACGTRCG